MVYINDNTKPPQVTKITIHYEDGSSDFIGYAPPKPKALPLYVWKRERPGKAGLPEAYTKEEIAALLFKTAYYRSMSTYYVIDPILLKPMKEYAKTQEKVLRKNGNRSMLPHGNF